VKKSRFKMKWKREGTRGWTRRVLWRGVASADMECVGLEETDRFLGWQGIGPERGRCCHCRLYLLFRHKD
jgi:hypothetical protein